MDRPIQYAQRALHLWDSQFAFLVLFHLQKMTFFFFWSAHIFQLQIEEMTYSLFFLTTKIGDLLIIEKTKINAHFP